MNGGHQDQPSLPLAPSNLHYDSPPEVEIAALIDSSALTELTLNVSSGFPAWTPGPGITSSSSSSSSSSGSCPTIYMPSPARSPPLQPAIIGTGTGTGTSTGTGVAEVLCELHHAPEHSTGTQLRLLVSQAHVDAIQPTVTVDGLSGGPILWPWAYLSQRCIKRGQANKAGWVAFFVCDINWDLLECRNPDQMHRPTRHRLSVTVTNSQGQVIYRHQVKQHRKRMAAGAKEEHSDGGDNDDDDDNDRNEASKGGEEDAVVLCHECFNRRNRFQDLALEKEAQPCATIDASTDSTTLQQVKNIDLLQGEERKWRHVGSINEYDALVAKYPFDEWKWGGTYNNVNPMALSILNWNRGLRVTFKHFYPQGDNGGTLVLGNAVWTRGTDDEETKNCKNADGSPGFYHRYVGADCKQRDSLSNGLGGLSIWVKRH